uniref:K Homology domain-containing protein n=1 Tax=Alexandrium monilatum TaxID=311494 RepID=A0A7S4PYI4_9DINO
MSPCPPRPFRTRAWRGRASQTGASREPLSQSTPSEDTGSSSATSSELISATKTFSSTRPRWAASRPAIVCPSGCSSTRMGSRRPKTCETRASGQALPRRSRRRPRCRPRTWSGRWRCPWTLRGRWSGSRAPLSWTSRGVHIQILQPRTPGGPQIAQIVGPVANADYACELVDKKLEEISEARRHYDIIRGVAAPPADTIPSAGRELLQAAVANSAPGAWSVTEADLAGDAAVQEMALERLMLERAQEPGAGMTCGTPDMNGEVLHEMELPPDLIGAFVGRQGSSITDLQVQAGGCHIQVQPPIAPGGPQTASITGAVLNANIGLLLARQKLDELRDARLAYNEMRSDTGSPGFASAGASASVPPAIEATPATVVPPPASEQQLAHPASQGGLTGEVSEDIQVAPDLVGALVGKGGSSIMDLQRRAGSGVHIQIQQPAYRGAPQMATVSGTPAGVASGARLVRERLREIQQQRALYEPERPARTPPVPPPAPGGQSAAWGRGPPALAPVLAMPARPAPAPAAPAAVNQQALVTLLQALIPAQRPPGVRPLHR